MLLQSDLSRQPNHTIQEHPDDPYCPWYLTFDRPCHDRLPIRIPNVPCSHAFQVIVISTDLQLSHICLQRSTATVKHNEHSTRHKQSNNSCQCTKILLDKAHRMILHDSQEFNPSSPSSRNQNLTSMLMQGSPFNINPGLVGPKSLRLVSAAAARALWNNAARYRNPCPQKVVIGHSGLMCPL